MISSRLAGVVAWMLVLFAPGVAAVAMADDDGVTITIHDGGIQGSGQSASPGHHNGAPGDDVAAASPGANPGVPLGPGH